MSIALSVVVPVYNTEKLLPRCLDSLQNQNREDLEFILVDDGSGDSSLEICSRYAREDGRFRVLHQENAGSVAARNAGIACARGEFLAFVDSDDYVDPDFFCRLLEANREADADVVAAAFLEEGKKTAFKQMHVPGGLYEGEDRNKILAGLIAEDMNGLRTLFPALWSKLFRTSLLRQHYQRISPRLRLAEDLTLVSYCCGSARSILVVSDNQSFYHYILHPGQLTRRFDPRFEQRLPVVFDSIKAVHEVCHLENFQNQMDLFVLFFARKGFENLFFTENDLDEQEKKARVRQICRIARQYRTSRSLWDPVKVNMVKKFLVNSGNYFLISRLYRKMDAAREK